MSEKKDVVLVLEMFGDTVGALQKAVPELEFKKLIDDEAVAGMSMVQKYLRRIAKSELEQMQKADILVVPATSLSQVIFDVPNVKWVQLLDTGADRLLKAADNSNKALPTFPIARNVSEDIGVLIAEYVVGQIISHERSFHECRRSQSQKYYAREKVIIYRSLHQLTVGIMGLGPLGVEVARAMKFFRSRVVGYTRTPRKENEKLNCVDAYWHEGQMSSFLSECDYIICVLPSTTETRGLIGGDVLKDAKKCPVLINVGRGDLISEKDVLKALDSGWISEAILDVFEQEPVPESSLLWTHPKVQMTPHVSACGNSDLRITSIVDSFTKNYQRFLRKETLIGQVDWRAGY